METICPACKGEIPEGAQVCMHCRARQDRYYSDGTRRTAPWVIPVIIATVLVLLAGAMWNHQRLEEERSRNNVCSLLGTC